MCVCVFVSCPLVLLVSIIHSLEDDLTALRPASRQPAEPAPFSQIPLSSPRYLPIAVPAPATVSRLHCIFFTCQHLLFRVSYLAKSSSYFFFFSSLIFRPYLLFFPFKVSICFGDPPPSLLRLPPLLNDPRPSLILSLCLSISVFSPSLALCCLNKVAFIRMSCNPNKPNKRYGWENLPAEEGRILSCQPLCASLPTGDAPRRRQPLPKSHTHTH